MGGVEEIVHRDASRDRESAGRALVWSFSNTVLARLGTLPVGIVLARLLGPEEFGTFAVAVVALLAILSFNELGVSLAIVRWPEEPDEIAPTVTTISIVMSAILTGISMLCAPWFAAAMGDPDAANVVRWMSLCVLINGIVATPAAVMQRMFRQDQRLVADQVNTWLGAIVSVVLAFLGVGAMSLVVGRLAGASVSAVLFLHYNPLPYRLGIDRRYLRPLMAFGVPLAGASMVAFLASFLDQLLVGHLLGAVVLGYYVLAFNLASWPVTLFSAPLRMVLPAMFAQRQSDPDRMARDFAKVLRPLALIALPACVLLSVAAPQIISLIYGERWLPATPVFRWLALFAVARILFELCYDFLVVLGRSHALLLVQLVWLPVLCAAVVLGIHQGGPAGAALGLGLSSVVPMTVYVLELSRAGIRPAALLRTVLPAGAVGLATVGAYAAVSGVAGPWWGTVAAGVATGAGALAAVWFWREDLTVFRPTKDTVVERDAVALPVRGEAE